VPGPTRPSQILLLILLIQCADLHGDLANALSVLRSASLVDLRGQWIGKTATLVQTGDIVDRGKDTIALYALMDTLRAQAKKDGGEVISLLGNHEVSKILYHFSGPCSFDGCFFSS
jgi:3',5'-cyclic AMP phosphodiesterase CpdA